MMTIDSLMMQPQAYQSKIHELVFAYGLMTYGSMAARSEPMVSKEEFVGLVYADVYIEIRDQLVEEGIHRKDYELFGLDKEEYLRRSYSGQMEDVAVHPFIKESLFHEAINHFIAVYQLTMITNDGEVIHCPLQEVW